MFEERHQKILLGNSIPLPEEDLDDAYVESEYGKPVEEEALKEYYFITITDNIGREDFKENYLAVINQIIRNYDVHKQQMLCEAIMNQVRHVYDYFPPTNVDINSDDDVINILDFIQFIEYEHEEFILDIWEYLKPETNLKSFQNYCEQNGNKIISEIEEQLDTKAFPELITNFLRTYNKDDMIQWFCDRSERLNTAIQLRIREE
ncbi:MAG: hypothetical protein ACTSX1_04030 [Candidatus Heimdallarchaeaceae archaeon]